MNEYLQVIQNMGWSHYLVATAISVTFFIAVCLFMKIASRGGSALSVCIAITLVLIAFIIVHLVQTIT